MLIAQYRGRGFTSGAIRFLTRSPYSHSAFLFDAETEAAADRLAGSLRHLTSTSRGSVVEAWLPRVRNTYGLGYGHEQGTAIDLFELKEPLTRFEEQELLLFLNEEIGWRYGVLNVLRFVTKRPGNLDRTWFCSELVFAGLNRVNRLLLRETEAWEVPPDWIARSPLLKFKKTVTLGERAVA